jgi:hypothetical protein
MNIHGLKAVHGIAGLLCIAASALVAGCPGEITNAQPYIEARSRDAGAQPDAGGSDPTCPDVATEILGNTDPGGCATGGCHSASDPQAELDLASENRASRLAGTAAHQSECGDALLLDPDAPEQSLLYRKLGPEPPCGTRMPLGGSLPEHEQQCVLEWIKATVQ